MHTVRYAVSVLALALIIGCGGSGSPTAPSAPAIPQYAGNWSGTYTISGCDQTGAMAVINVCGVLGNQAPYTMPLTQSGSNVSGSFALGQINFGNTGGTVGADGSLQLQGSTEYQGSVGIQVKWQLTLNGAHALTGTITEIWTSNQLPGQANIVGTITTANH